MEAVSGDSSGLNSVQEDCQNLTESLGHVVCLLGRLSLSWRVGKRRMGREGEPSGGDWMVGESVENWISREVS